MRIGFAQKDITPEAETFGSFRLSGVKRHSGVHDPLFAHALVIDADQRRCLLLSIDVAAIPTRRATELRQRLAKTVGIEPAAVLLAATHTHNGPETLNEESDSRQELERIRGTEWRAVVADEERQDEAFGLYQKYRTTLWKQLLGERYGNKPVESVPVQCIYLGPLTLVAVPGELFVEHQLRLQEQFPDHRVAIVGYANGYAGYIPTREALAQETYETQATLMHRVDGEAGERLMTAAAGMIRSLHREHPSRNNGNRAMSPR